LVESEGYGSPGSRAPLADERGPLEGFSLDTRLRVPDDQVVDSEGMELFVVLLFALPVVIAFAVVAIKTVELALHREIASVKDIAVKTSVFVFGTAALAMVAWFVYVVIAMSGDPS